METENTVTPGYDPTEAWTEVPTEAWTEVPSADPVDADQLFADATSVLTNVILCAALLIAGVLCGIRFWR